MLLGLIPKMPQKHPTAQPPGNPRDVRKADFLIFKDISPVTLAIVWVVDGTLGRGEAFPLPAPQAVWQTHSSTAWPQSPPQPLQGSLLLRTSWGQKETHEIILSVSALHEPSISGAFVKPSTNTPYQES